MEAETAAPLGAQSATRSPNRYPLGGSLGKPCSIICLAFCLALSQHVIGIALILLSVSCARADVSAQHCCSWATAVQLAAAGYAQLRVLVWNTVFKGVSSRLDAANVAAHPPSLLSSL